MIIAVSLAVVVVVLLYVVVIRRADLPFVEPLSPTAHLDERKAAIFENIRDANFEFLMGKLSQGDYQQTKADLQKELADVNAEIAGVEAKLGKSQDVAAKGKVVTGKAKAPAAKPTAAKTAPPADRVETPDSRTEFGCPHCGATFSHAMKFCGECGKPMEGTAQ